MVNLILPTDSILEELAPVETLFEQLFFSGHMAVEHFVHTWSQVMFGQDPIIQTYNAPTVELVDTLVLSDLLGHLRASDDDGCDAHRCLNHLLLRLRIEILPFLELLEETHHGLDSIGVRRWLGDSLVVQGHFKRGLPHA